MNQRTIKIILLSIASPVSAFYIALKSRSIREKKSVLIVLIVITGSIMLAPPNADYNRYIQNLDNYSDMGFEEFTDGCLSILSFSGDSDKPDDLYVFVVSYFTAGFLGLPWLFKIIVSYVFAYFYVNSLFLILCRVKIKKSIILGGLILIFIVYRGVDSMQTVRTWTGFWILFYSIVQYYLTHKTRYLFFMLVAPMVHAAYMVMALPAYAVIFIRKLTPKFFVIIFLASFFVSINPLGIIDRMSSTNLGDKKVRAYYRENPEDYDDWGSHEMNWYVLHGKGKTFIYANLVLAFAIILTGLYNKTMTSIERNLFSTGLLMASLGNILKFVPEIYARTMAISGIYFIATALLLTSRIDLFEGSKRLTVFRKILFSIALIMYFPKFVYTAANLIYYFSIFIVLFPFIPWVSESTNISIREVIGFIL